MPLPKLFWRHYHCSVCGRFFELPPDTEVLPPHQPPRRDAVSPCPGRDPEPA